MDLTLLERIRFFGVTAQEAANMSVHTIFINWPVAHGIVGTVGLFLVLGSLFFEGLLWPFFVLIMGGSTLPVLLVITGQTNVRSKILERRDRLVESWSGNQEPRV